MYVIGFSIGNMPVFISVAIYIHLHPRDSTVFVMPYYYLYTVFRRMLLLAPIAIVEMVNGYNAIMDIQNFLLAEENVDGKGFNLDTNLSYAIELEDAQFTWGDSLSQKPDTISETSDDITVGEESAEVKEAFGAFEDQPSFQLKPMNLSVGTGELVAIVGHVGSGKSSLAAALARDMVRIRGTVNLRCLPSYCPQSPWIQNASVRENIIFGQEHDASLYARIITVCAIERDLSEMPDGDETILGELGINISGGQKQGIQLARTLYQGRNIVILDDPLSAVDAHTGDHIFQQAICQHLANTCRILITQQLHILQRCDRIIWMHEGAIKATGTYQTLCRLPEFVEFMGTCEQRRHEPEIESNDAPKTLQQSPINQSLQFMEDEDVNVKRLQWREHWHFLRLSTSKSFLAMATAMLLLNAAANLILSLGISWWARGGIHGLSVSIVATFT